MKGFHSHFFSFFWYSLLLSFLSDLFWSVQKKIKFLSRVVPGRVQCCVNIYLENYKFVKLYFQIIFKLFSSNFLNYFFKLFQLIFQIIHFIKIWQQNGCPYQVILSSSGFKLEIFLSLDRNKNKKIEKNETSIHKN